MYSVGRYCEYTAYCGVYTYVLSYIEFSVEQLFVNHHVRMCIYSDVIYTYIPCVWMCHVVPTNHVSVTHVVRDAT